MDSTQNENRINRQEKPLFRKYLPIIGTAAAGVLISFILFALVKTWEFENLRIDFESRSQGYANAVESTLHDYVEGLYYIGDFFNNSEQVTRKEFSNFVLSIISRHPGIQAFSWNPLILNSERAYYESLAKEDGFENFMFTERTENNELVRAALRDEYVVVYYIEPLDNNKPALGYDIASDPKRRAAIKRGFDTGNMSVTERITLVQETGEQFGVLLLLPLYKQNVPLNITEDRRKHRRGFVVEVLRIGDAVEHALKNFPDEDIDTYLYDLSAEEANSFLYYRPTGTSEVAKPHLQKKEIKKGIFWSKKVGVADHQWQILFTPSSFYYNFQQSWQSWLVLAGSLFVTGMAALYIYRKLNYTEQIEQQLLKNEQILQTTMEGFIVADITGRIIEVNSSYCSMSGYTHEELLKMNIRDVDVTLSYEEIDLRIQKMVEQGRDRYETRHRCKDGNIIDLDVSVVIMQSEKAPLVAAFVRDVTERKRVERVLMQERMKAQQYLDTVDTIIVSLDNKGIITMINRSGCDLLGYSEKELIGKNWFETCLPQPEGIDTVYPYFMQIIDEKIESEEYFENFVLLHDGTQRLIAWHNALLRNEKGEISGTLSSGDDITDRKMAEESLIKSENKFRSVVESTPMGMHMYHLEADNRLVFTGYNHAADQILGVDNSQFIGKTIEEAFPPLTATEVPGHYRRAAAQGEPWSTEQIMYEHDEISGAFQVYAFQTEPGKMVAMFFDITEKMKAESEQKRLSTELTIKNKELEEILYVTSHDLRSPLVNVEGYSMELDYSLKNLMSSLENADVPSGIKEKLTPIVKEEIPDSLYYIQKSVEKMETLLKGILSLSRLGRYQPEIEEIDMNELISDIIDNHRFRLNELSIKAEVSILPGCRGDSSQINQVFSNLFDNAIKYSDPERSGVIHISGYTDKDQSVYCMEDNGIGIAPEHQDKIFEIFYQLNPREVMGDGMGLTIAHRIIEKHNGKIWVESELGRGSKFFVSLPEA